MAKNGGSSRKGGGAEPGGAPAPAADKVKPSETLTMISAPTLVKLLKSADSRKQEVDKLVGEMREEIGNAKEKKHLNTGMFALLRRFNNYKSNEKLAHDWDTLCAYMDMAGLMKRIESVGKLQLDGGEGDDETDGAGDKTGEGGTVVEGSFGSGRARTPEPVH